MILPPVVGGVPQGLNLVFYVVNSGKLFAMGSDPVTLLTPLLNGVVLQQQSPIGGFTNNSLNGGTVVHLTGLAVCAVGGGAAPLVVAGLLTANGTGLLNLADDENCGGTPMSVQNLPGPYSVSGNGRAALTLGTASLAVYLVGSGQAFFLVADGPVLIRVRRTPDTWVIQQQHG
jgi:hypothetical protein